MKQTLGAFAGKLLALLLTTAMAVQGQYVSTGDQYVPQTPPSWNATSILSAAYRPTGLYTGTTDVAVPIYTAQSRKLSIPIALRYEPGGVKVGRMASWVGLNWSLEAGGVIGRVANGAYDTYTTTAGVGTYNVAAEPDVFHFSVMGRSGRFALFTQGGPTVWRTMPNSNLRITPKWSTPNGTAVITGFTLVDESGTVFDFDAVEQTRIAINGSQQALQNTAFYLTRVRPVDYGDEVVFAYDSLSISAQFLARSAKSLSLGQRYHTAAAQGLPLTAPSNHSASSCNGCPITAMTLADTLFVTQEVVKARRLRRITFVNGYVEFSATTARADLPGDARLDTVKVVQTYWGPGQHKVIARWKLDYGSFGATSGVGRLKLTALRQLYVEEGQEKSLTTSFAYDESAPLPPRSSNAVDAWGYFNNATANTSVAPGIANRDTLGSAARRGILTRVTTALGAETHYTYESHLADAMVGGARIRRVELRPDGVPTDTSNIIRTYSYGTPGSPSWSQQGSKLTSTSPIGTPNFCRVSLSADGNTLAVAGSADNSNQGAVWVYTRSGSSWTHQAKITPTGNIGAAEFGVAVSISSDGNTLLIGGWKDNSSVGAAWVYVRSSGSWSYQAKLVGSDRVGASEQGWSVGLSADGNTALVGGRSDNSNQGAGWIFVRSGTTWSQQGNKLVGTAGVGASRRGMGAALSGDGNTAFLGGHQDNSNQGAVWVFTRSGTSWSQQGSKLVGTGNSGAANQGVWVATSQDGNTVIWGGQADGGNVGAAWIFVRSGTTWSQQGGKLVGTGGVAPSGQGWFVSLSVDGNTAAVGGWWDNSNAGAAWVWVRSGTTWTQQGSKFVGSGATGLANQGRVSLSSDGNMLVLGGGGDNSGQGAVWTYARTVPLATTGLRLSVPTYYDQTLWKVTSPSGCTPPGGAPNLACGTRVQASFTHTDFWVETPIEYLRVDENLGASAQYGRSAFTYTTRQTANGADGLSTTFAGTQPTRREWRRGLLTSTTHFDMANPASPQTVQDATTSFIYFDTPTNNWRNHTGTSTATFLFGGDSYPRNGTYAMESGWVAPSQTINRGFTQDAVPVLYSDTTRFTYSPSHLHLVEEEVFRAAGKSHGTLYLYADSSRYDSTSATSDVQARSLWHLRRLNVRGVTVETISYQRAYQSSTREVLGSSLQKFQVVNSQRGTTPRIYETLNTYLSAPLALSSFTLSGVVGASFSNDSRYPSYNQNGRILLYNIFGQPTQSQDPRGVYSSTLWGYNSTIPVASAQNSGWLAYGSFEEESQIAFWESYNWSRVTSAASYSGRNSYQINSSESISTADQVGQGYLSFWVKSQAASGAIRIQHGGTPIDINATPEWTLHVVPVQNTFLTIQVPTGVSGVFLDDIRSQPVESLVSSIVVEPLIGPTAVFNAQNSPVFTEYDALNRPYLTRNKDKDILQIQSFKIKQ